MKLWPAAQLPPSLALWIANRFKIEAYAVKGLNLLAAKDEEISSTVDRLRMVERYEHTLRSTNSQTSPLVIPLVRQGGDRPLSVVSID